MFSTMLVVLILIGAASVVVVRRGLQMRRLVENGVPTRARVEKKTRFRGSSNVSSIRLKYSFAAGDATRYERTITMSQAESAAYEEGAEIEIVYLPERPQVSAAKAMVELARRSSWHQLELDPVLVFRPASFSNFLLNRSAIGRKIATRFRDKRLAFVGVFHLQPEATSYYLASELRSLSTQERPSSSS